MLQIGKMHGMRVDYESDAPASTGIVPCDMEWPHMEDIAVGLLTNEADKVLLQGLWPKSRRSLEARSTWDRNPCVLYLRRWR